MAIEITSILFRPWVGSEYKKGIGGKLLPTDRWQWGEEIVVDGLPATRFGYYTLADGTRVKAIPVRHPSAGYSWTKWHRMIADFVR